MILCSANTECTPFDTWSVYTAMSLHFKKNSAYDAFKFNFKGPRCKRETFMANRHRYFFEKITKTYRNKNSIIEFFLANILDGNTYVTNMNEQSYAQWTARVQRIDYDFRSFMSDMSSRFQSFDSIIIPNSKERLPPI